MGDGGKLELTTTQSDLTVLQEKGFILEKVIGEGSYAKVCYRFSGKLAHQSL